MASDQWRTRSTSMPGTPITSQITWTGRGEGEVELLCQVVGQSGGHFTQAGAPAVHLSECDGAGRQAPQARVGGRVHVGEATRRLGEAGAGEHAGRAGEAEVGEVLDIDHGRGGMYGFNVMGAYRDRAWVSDMCLYPLFGDERALWLA
ncbi:hypothetical protein AB0K48_55500 [Nonomuraea sp. NPDC055795]